MARTPKLSQAEVIAAVKDHAQAHYGNSKSGTRWDYVIETMGDSDIADIVGKSTSAKGAIRRMWQHLQPISERHREHDAEAAAGM